MMKLALLAVFLGLIASTWADKLDLDDIEKKCKVARFEDVNPELDGPARANLNFCKCNDLNRCECCANPKVFGHRISGCILFRYEVDPKRIHVELKALNKKIIDTNFGIDRFQQLCGNLPGRASMLSFCFNTDNVGDERTGLTSCSSLDIKVKSQTAAVFRFSCLSINQGKLTFQGYPQGNAIVSIKVKNPMQFVVHFIKKVFKG